MRRADRDAAGGYREAAGGWVMESSDARPLIVAAVQASDRAPALGPFRLAAAVAVAGLLSYGTLRGIGSLAAHRMADRNYPNTGQPLELGNVDAIAIAAATPGHRGGALDELVWALDRHRYHDRAALGRRLAAAELQGGCREVARVLLANERLEDALARARRCGDRRVEWRALTRLGRYAEAAALEDAGYDPRWPGRAGAVAIAAGRWDLAATAADEVAASVDEPTADEQVRVIRSQREVRFRCLAQLFRLRAGDEAARGRLDALAREGGRACALIATEALPPGEREARRTALIAAWPEDVDAGLLFHGRALDWADGAP